jgi:hypothetical protein
VYLVSEPADEAGVHAANWAGLDVRQELAEVRCARVFGDAGRGFLPGLDGD